MKKYEYRIVKKTYSLRKRRFLELLSTTIQNLLNSIAIDEKTNGVLAFIAGKFHYKASYTILNLHNS